MLMRQEPKLPPLLVRADADSNQGMGHVMRCLALAQVWEARGGRVVFMSCCPSGTFSARIEAVNSEFMAVDRPHPDSGDIKTTLATLKGMIRDTPKPPWVVIDGYHFNAEYQNRLREKGCRLLVIDDNAHMPHYDADIVLNHGFHAPRLSYPCSASALLLLGTRYALLRPEFQFSAVNPKTIADNGRKILVTLGGSDPGNVTLKIIQALEQMDNPGLEARVVVGPMNPHGTQLQHAAAQSTYRVSLMTAVQDLSSLMQWADLAVSAAGGTCLELASQGIPMVNVIAAENQRLAAAELEATGVGVNLGWHDDITVDQIAVSVDEILRAPERRAQMSSRGRALVDGRGAKRVVGAMWEKSCLKAA